MVGLTIYVRKEIYIYDTSGRTNNYPEIIILNLTHFLIPVFIFPSYQTITLPIVKGIKYLLLLQMQKSILHMNAITSYNCSPSQKKKKL